MKKDTTTETPSLELADASATPFLELADPFTPALDAPVAPSLDEDAVRSPKAVRSHTPSPVTPDDNVNSDGALQVEANIVPDDNLDKWSQALDALTAAYNVVGNEVPSPNSDHEGFSSAMKTMKVQAEPVEHCAAVRVLD